MTTDTSFSGSSQDEEDLAMPLRWSGYRLLRRGYNHVAPPEPRFPRKRDSRSIRKALDRRFCENDVRLTGPRSSVRVFIVLVETKC